MAEVQTMAIREHQDTVLVEVTDSCRLEHHMPLLDLAIVPREVAQITANLVSEQSGEMDVYTDYIEI